MAELFKRPGVANWYAWIKDPRVSGGLVKRSTKCRVKSEARAVADTMQAAVHDEVAALLATDAAGPALYWVDAAAMFLRLAPLKASTAEGHRYQIKVIEAAFGDFNVRDLTVKEIKEFVTARRTQIVDQGHKGRSTRTVSDATIRRNVSLLSAVYNFVIEREIPGAPARNPVLDYNRRSLKESPLVDRNLRPEQFQAVMDACQNDEQRRIVVTLVGTGMRSGELVGLTWPEVDLPAAIIEFGNLEPSRSKSSRTRRVALGTEVVTALTAQSTAQKKVGRFTPAGYVFPSPRHPYNRRLNLSGIRKRLKRVTGIELYTNHALRATFASWSLQQNVEPIAIRDQLGHSTMSTTTRYAHHTSDSSAAQIRGMRLPVTAQSTAQDHRSEGEAGRKRGKLMKEFK